MSAELHDFRGKLTVRTACALEARSQATGKSQQEIVRDVLDQWAADEVHAAMVLHRQLLAQGLGGIDGGMRGNAGEPGGNLGEPQGMRGNGGRA